MFLGFLFLLGWLLLPPLLVGVLLLTRSRGNAKVRLWKQLVILGVVSVVLEVLFLVAGPDHWGRHVGVRDVQVFGWQTMWAPFAWLAVAIALPPVYFGSRRSRTDAL